MEHSSSQKDFQFSPDIDSFCVSTSMSRQQDCSTSGARKEEMCTEVEEEEIMAKEEETRSNDGNGSTEDSPAYASFLLKWENDKVRTL